MAFTTVVTAPAHLPITVAEAQAHLREEQDDHDQLTMLDVVMRAATDRAEAFLNRRLVTQTVDYVTDRFPTGDFIELPGGRLQSITSLTYTDSDDADTVWAGTNYFAATGPEPGRLHLAYGISWPSVTLKPAEAVTVRYVVGYGTGDQVPYSIRAALLLIIEDLWNNTSDQMIGQGITAVKLPRGAEALMGPYKLHSF